MSRFSLVVIKVMRILFLVLAVASAVAVSYYLYRVAVPRDPAEVMALNVQQPQPIEQWAAQVTQAKQRVAAGQSNQVVARSATGQYVYREASHAQRVLLRLTAASEPLPTMLALLILTYLIFRILRDIRPGVPFTAANVRRIQGIGILLIACDVYSSVATWWLKAHLARVAPAGVTLLPADAIHSSLISNWLVGVMLLLIAAGYQRGVELAQDAELTV